MRLGPSLVALVFALSSVSAAAAPSRPKRAAAALIDEGNALMRRAKYRAALARYEAAHATYPTPKIFYNMGVASQELGRLVEAANYYERFLEESGVRRRSKLRRAARKRLKRMERSLSFVAVSERAIGAAVFIDGERVGSAPIATRRILPGRHEIVLDKPGFELRRVTVDLRAGQRETIDIALEPRTVAKAPPPAPPPPDLSVRPPPPPPTTVVTTPAPEVDEDDDSITSKWWFWTALVAVAATGAVVTTVAVRGGGDEFELGGDLGVSSTADWDGL